MVVFVGAHQKRSRRIVGDAISEEVLHVAAVLVKHVVGANYLANGKGSEPFHYAMKSA